MLSSIKDRLKRPPPQHIRVHSQDDLTQLTQLSPWPRTPYGNPAASASDDYLSRSAGYDDGSRNMDNHGDGEEQPLTGEERSEFRRGMRDDGYPSPPLPVSMSHPRKKKSRFNWAFWIKLVFCAALLGAYVFLYHLSEMYLTARTIDLISSEVNPRPHAISSGTWRAPMIIAGLLGGTALIVCYIYPWIASKYRPSARSSMLGLIHRNNRQIARISLWMILFAILLPINFAVTPNIIANAIAQKMFDSACDGWETSYVLYGIPTNDTVLSNGDLLYNGELVGSVTFSGAETGWRVMYTRDPNAPSNFNDNNLTQVIFDERDLGQSFTTECTQLAPIQNASAGTVDCTTGSALSFVMYNMNTNVSMFTANQVPLVSLIFSPPASSLSANYSNWQEGPPLGTLVDQNLNEQIKVVRSGSANACTGATKVCGRDLLESYAAMAYVWRSWQEWGLGMGNC